MRSASTPRATASGAMPEHPRSLPRSRRKRSHDIPPPAGARNRMTPSLPPQTRPFSTHDHIRSIARASCQTLGRDLRITALAQIEKTSDERITTLAYEFREVLYKNGAVIPLEIVEQLSLANLYGWMAYGIYDDALDGEDRDGGGCGRGPSLLPCANFFLRALTEIYGSLDARTPGAKALFGHTMDRIDEANAWEQSHCRVDVNNILHIALPSFGDYQMLADRSIGHGIGPLAELLYAGYPPHSKEHESVDRFFRHYLIARQLHDDAHDWADDLLRGRMNSIGALVLRHHGEKYPGGAKAKPPAAIIRTTSTIPDLKKIFWEEVIDDVSAMIRFHVAAARKRENNPSSLRTPILWNARSGHSSPARGAPSANATKRSFFSMIIERNRRLVRRRKNS